MLGVAVQGRINSALLTRERGLGGGGVVVVVVGRRRYFLTQRCWSHKGGDFTLAQAGLHTWSEVELHLV